MSALDLEAIRKRSMRHATSDYDAEFPDRALKSVQGDLDRLDWGLSAALYVDGNYLRDVLRQARSARDVPDLLTEVTRLRSLVEEAASALVQRGFTDRAQWLRNKAENGEGR